MKTNWSVVVLLVTLGVAYTQDKFQKCCGERKLYFQGECYSALQQGPCREGEWLVMERGRQEGSCQNTPCESPIQFLKNGECIFGVDITKRGLLCGADKRPWYNVYGDWDCQVSTYITPQSTDLTSYRKSISPSRSA